jgi:DNA repair protein RecO (recombination protein O)
MPLYKEQGIVLRSIKLGEADKIVSILTQGSGKVRAVAKGIRKTTSKFGARLEPTSRVALQCYKGRELDIVTQAETVDAFGVGLVGDYGRYTAGCAVLETADRLVAEEGEPALRVYLLVVGAIRALSGRERDPSLVLDAFFLRAMTHAGWAPAINDCARCAAPGPHPAFNVAAGGAVCPTCRPPGSVTPSRETFVLLDALLNGEWHIADAATPTTRRDTSGLVAAHLQWHMERQLRSLPLVERRASTRQ